MYSRNKTQHCLDYILNFNSNAGKEECMRRWFNGQINEPEFAKGIGCLVQEKNINVKKTGEPTKEVGDANIASVPIRVGNNAA